MASRNFVWGLEQCFDYVTSSSDFRLSNGTNMMAVAHLEEIGHAFFKKRPPHLGFESYCSILILINSYDFWLKIRKFPKYDGNGILPIFHGFYNFESSKARNYGSEHVSTLPIT